MMEARGVLLDPKRFSIHDGPGIRTTFFFKGCVLKCPWCHNPESISPRPQLGYYDQKCISCMDCAEVCSADAHVFSGGRHLVDRTRCTLCGKCAEICPGRALKLYGKTMSVGEVVKIALADAEFYRKSGGGITLSGGEPLLQIEFVEALLKVLKQENLHTAIDTCGCVKTSVFERVLSFTDIFLVDFKHADTVEHRRLTGMGNELVKANLQWLSARGAQIEIRIPVVPGCNDTPANMRQTAEFLCQLDLEAVRVLPYHSLAGGKYRAIDMPNTLPQVPPPGREELAAFAALLREKGLTVKY